jgi:hypothetical protein
MTETRIDFNCSLNDTCAANCRDFQLRPIKSKRQDSNSEYQICLGVLAVRAALLSSSLAGPFFTSLVNIDFCAFTQSEVGQLRRMRQILQTASIVLIPLLLGTVVRRILEAEFNVMLKLNAVYELLHRLPVVLSMTWRLRNITPSTNSRLRASGMGNAWSFASRCWFTMRTGSPGRCRTSLLLKGFPPSGGLPSADIATALPLWGIRVARIRPELS